MTRLHASIRMVFCSAWLVGCGVVVELPEDLDAGQPSYDAGQPPHDAGQPSYDAGQPPYDAGQPPHDAGQPQYDAGEPSYDAGQPPYDAGQPPYDAGQPPYDAGTDLSPRGIYSLSTPNSAAVQLAKPYVTGTLIRARWSQIQPTSAASYDWSTIDSQLKTAVDAGKKASIVVFTGSFNSAAQGTPDWVFSQAGARRWVMNGLTMPDPMDPLFWATWKTFVRAFGERYKNHPSVAQVSMCGGTGSLCGLRFQTLPNLVAWDETFILTQWKANVDTFVEAFGDTPLTYEVHMAVPPAGTSASPTRFIQSMRDYLAPKYGRRVGPFVEFLSNTQPSGDVADLIKTWRAQSGWCGVQQVAPQGANLDASYVHGYTDLGCKYFEVYESDLASSYATINQAWHDKLSVASPVTPQPSSCPALQSGVDLVPGSTAAPTCTTSTPVTLAYGSGSSAQVLDLYRPTGAGPHPTVIWIHGGGWRGGSRTQLEEAKRLVCRGYAVAAIDYRLSTAAPFPAQLHDVKAAIRFLRAQATTWGLDATRFATFGSSAGGHLSALAATSAGVAALEDLTQGNAGFSSAVQAAVDWYGPTDFSQMDPQLLAQGCPANVATHGSANSPESLLLACTVSDAVCAPSIASANPVTYVSASTPPIYMLHGTTDCTVPRAQSDLLKAAMDAAGRCGLKRNLQGAGHGGAAWSSSPPQDAVAEFLDAVLKP